MNKFLTLTENLSASYEVRGDVLIVQKWEWDFSECEEFQQKAQAFIQKNRDLKVYIFTNHPHCYTLGRGNERGDKSLVAFDDTSENEMGFPLHRIHRGGGVTFHYPGQWIFYPIVAIKESFSLEDVTCWLLSTIKNVLTEDFGIDQVLSAKKLMGVWRKKQKLASIGIGVSRFVTIHGIALNLVHDEKMFLDLNKINPCGMTPTTYICIDQISSLESKGLVETFHKHFISHLKV